ncbi:methyltransferase-like protein 2 isoform X4 [Manihot esculenta]|uniref:methyltransferase-like protein 2 isoform X4 n=1 Tax=Manihot esculenta TaxID=3983 RepID=UPI001CC760F6|nr:methyltransferase-like protein 2 isoform X4 [Manihot esculenta]
MEESKTSDRLSVFLDSGIYRFENSNVVFIDPVRVLNLSYNRHRVSPTAYYSRFFHSKCSGQDRHETKLSSSSKKRKRREKKPHSLNERERAADQRHRQARPMLLKALECLLTATDLLAIMRNLRSESCPFECREAPLHHNEHALTELCRVWQAPLYEITLNFPKHHEPSKDVGSPIDQCNGQRIIPVFNNLVVNETISDVDAEFLNEKYILPRESCFYMVCLAFKLFFPFKKRSQINFIACLDPLHFIYHDTVKCLVLYASYFMPNYLTILLKLFSCIFFHVLSSIMSKSDLEQVHNLIPAESDCGFNLIVVDPPWENASASQKLLYPTLPNRYFLSLPIKQLAHIDGALIALWVTNREKLRNFVEKELFPSWGAHYAATFYWLKSYSSHIGESRWLID